VAAAKPILDEWKDQQINLKSVLNKLQKDAPEIKRTIEELPTLARQFLNTDLRSNNINEGFIKSASKTFYQSLLGLAVMLVGGALLGLEVLAGWWLLGFGFIVLLLSKPKP
jgi:predicted unusual protein kinase regulating ubiquinone biosynthesis (AarF/ABC1/UbiB family)